LAVVGNTDESFDPRRFIWPAALVFAAFSILIGRLYVLQVVQGETYSAKSMMNFVQERRVAHRRGYIYDQAGRPLVDNRPARDVYVTLALLPDSRRSLDQIANPLGLDLEVRDLLDRRILAAVNDPEPRPIVLAPLARQKTCLEVERVAESRDIHGIVVDGLGPLEEDGCRVAVDPREFPSRAAIFRKVREIVGLGTDDMNVLVKKALQKSRGMGRFKPVLLISDLNFTAYAGIEAAISLGEVPGVAVIDTERRRYIQGPLAGHALGFMNEISPKELKKRKPQGYRMGDMWGRRGLERQYESLLRGKDGLERVVVDAKGRNLGEAWAKTLLGPKPTDRIDPPVAGHSLVVSLDSEMQRVAETAFLGRAGSVVALEVNTGFVLAMASFPAYDPNLVTGRGSGKVLKDLYANPDRPFINKPIQDHYAPGSTFKAITAIAGLRKGVITPHTSKHCPGYFRLGRTTWRCYNRGGHGSVALLKALQYSCDTFFYSTGYELGPDRFAEGARLMGFGRQTGIDISGEQPGIIPDSPYYKKRFGAVWPGLVVNNSIGQGDVAVTPLQLAVAYGAIANGGKILRPQLVREILGPDGRVVEIRQPEMVAELDDDEAQHLHIVREALSHVTEPGGTAAGLFWRRDMPETSKWLRESGFKIAGKTGTAQVVRLSKSVSHIRPEDMEYEQRDHAWFVGFIPPEDPEIVVVTMTEHGGFGGSTSAPVVAQVMKAYFDHVRHRGRFGYGDGVTPGAPEDLRTPTMSLSPEPMPLEEAPGKQIPQEAMKFNGKGCPWPWSRWPS
jgi:penicillin-binding protein 2